MSIDLLIKGAELFQPDGSFATGDLAIASGRIVSAPGTDSHVGRVVEGAGKFALPGFIDCHVHVMTTSLNIVERLDTHLSYRFYQAARNLERTLAAGVTTVRDAAGADAGIRQAVEDGLIVGPRMQIAIAMISQTGGHGDRTTASGAWVASMPEHRGIPDVIADGADEMRKVVRSLVREGADVIKVATSGGVMSPRSNPKHGHYRLSELEVLVEEAAAAGIPTMAHAQSSIGIKTAVRAGIDSIEHGVFLDDEAIEMMLENRTVLVPTLMSGPGVLAAAPGISAENVRKVKAGIAAHEGSMSAAARAGVRIAMGTDTGVTPHGDNLKELALMESIGLEPSQVLLGATKVPAQLLGIDDEVGTLEIGMRADIVVVDGDPADLATLPTRIEMVIKEGSIVQDVS